MIDKKIFSESDTVLVNPAIEIVCEHILTNKEGIIGQNGAMIVDTGEFTGRSPNDKYFVEEDFSKNNLWWGPVNRKVNAKVYKKLYDKVIDYYKSSLTKTYIFEG